MYSTEPPRPGTRCRASNLPNPTHHQIIRIASHRIDRILLREYSARGATGAEAEDAAAGANVRVGGAWVTPGPRAFLGSRRTSDTGALSTSVFVASASTTGDVMAKA